MAAVDAFGTVWAFSTNGGGLYTDVADVTEIGVLDSSAETIDTTVHTSSGGWRTFIGGVKDGGELKMEINYDPALHNTIYGQLGTDSLMHRITLTDAGAATVTFTGILTGFSVGAPYDDKLSGSVTIKVSGPPVIAL